MRNVQHLDEKKVWILNCWTLLCRADMPKFSQVQQVFTFAIWAVVMELWSIRPELTILTVSRMVTISRWEGVCSTLSTCVLLLALWFKYLKKERAGVLQPLQLGAYS